jgi:hypothetical protein
VNAGMSYYGMKDVLLLWGKLPVGYVFRKGEKTQRTFI